MVTRPLRLYELILAQSNVNFMLHLESKNLKSDHVKQAFCLVKKRHPFFRMKINTKPDGTLEFVEMTSDDELETVYLEHYQLDSESKLSKWESRLITIGSKPHDSSKSTFYLELYSFENQHQLYGCVNHAGIDGPGLFQALNDFSVYLDLLLEHKILMIESKDFLDVHNEYEYPFSLDELKSETILEKFLEPVQKLENSQTDKSMISSKFYQLDEQTTKDLINNCKLNQSTIQGALSTAVALSLINSKPSNDEIVELVNSCPCNMRQFLKNVTHEDIICGSAALIWSHKINLSEDRLWNVVRTSTESIKSLLKMDYGLKWWIKLQNSIKTQGYSIMSSSMGVINFKEPQNYKIHDLRFLGSAYQIPPDVAGVMTHAFTFMNKFTFNFSFTYPALSHEWAEDFSKNILSVLKALSREDSKEMSLKQILLK